MYLVSLPSEYLTWCVVESRDFGCVYVLCMDVRASLVDGGLYFDDSGVPLSGVTLPGVPGVMVARVTKIPILSQAFLSRTRMPQPPGSELWQADSGASAMISNTSEHMYNVRYLDPNEQYIQIGDSALIRVAAVGSLDMRFHQIGVCLSTHCMQRVFPRRLYPSSDLKSLSQERAANIPHAAVARLNAISQSMMTNTRDFPIAQDLHRSKLHETHFPLQRHP